jgi:glycosyltransferase involved in cell wall biosynthesis
VRESTIIVGVFHPVINWCGGAEWVAINVINSLHRQGHNTVLMTDEEVDQQKISKIYGTRVNVDSQFILPLNIAPPGYYYNIYTHILRVLLLKTKCDLLIDTYSNDVLPKADIAYIHYPLLKRRSIKPTLRNRLFYFPYRIIQREINTEQKIVCANSHFTSQAVTEALGVAPYVLYPPISNSLFIHKEINQRDNQVITVARFDRGKNLEIIPNIAEKTSEDISYLIVGLMDSPSSPKILHSILKKVRELEISHRMKILTNVSRETLRACLLASKVYFHAAINEHFGVSIVEAMASGCIPVVNDSGGPREFVSKEFRYEDLDQAAANVEKAISAWSPQYAMKISSIAKKFSEDSFSAHFLRIFDLACQDHAKRVMK